ncbi:hypothetical protein F5878DRAFT_599477 [Lentinula raphanica]|uniref:Uncharacterized protein n=1 Tax=Lentinula raphanica TaxID=153919 RepID=A0AA38UKT0_9AGAR|nr:hypothetical protein F5878DRAFT_599477 [Lentinula raphanica]
MDSYLPLPNELLHSIIEYIAYTPTVPGHPSSRSLFKQYASPELLVLSETNWHLRRACLPFLFANIKVKNNQDATNFKDYLALFSTFTKILVIGAFDSLHGNRIEDKTILHFLPQLQHLFSVELHDCHARTDLLRTIIAHPTVTSVLIHELPDESMCDDDLSKVLYGYQTSPCVFSPRFEMYSNRGMRLACLELFNLDSLDKDQSNSEIFSGLEEIRMYMGVDLISSFWLSALLSTHSTLKDLWLLNYTQHSPVHREIPFLSSFLEEAEKQDLEKFFLIRQVGLRRALGQTSSREWYVMELTLKTTYMSTSLIEILMLVACSFPKLEVLTVDLDLHETMYDIDVLASVLARFLSLRILYLDNFFRRITTFESREMPHVHRTGAKDALEAPKSHVEHRLSLLTSRLAEQVRSLDSLHINEMGYEYDMVGSRRYWFFQGWLHVLNSKREVGGNLQSPLHIA